MELEALLLQLENLPDNSDIATVNKLLKEIKPLISKEHFDEIQSCFTKNNGWIMVGADFASLEDRINALLTKDPNKLKVYTDGYDGHCLRAYYYWKPEGIKDTIESINSIKKLFPELRQNSKAPTFALTYGGQYFTLMKNCGFTEAEAKAIEKNYHIMYEVSDQWISDKIDVCCQQGYIDVAFGLRIRTPVLAKSILGTSKTPYLATAEGRSVGNAISGQSYGLLTNRAMNAFMQLVWNSEYRTDILPIAMIHDAVYFIIKDDVRVVEWVNNNLIKEMAWQELPEIKHDAVHLGAELDLYPRWDKPITLANAITQKEIKDTVMKSK